MPEAPHKWETVISLPVAKVVADGVVDTSAAYLTGWDDETVLKNLPGTLNVVFRPTANPADMPMQLGGGNVTLVFSGTYDVGIWVRYDVDRESQSDAFFTAANLGACQLASLVFKSLNQYYPLDGSSNAYYIEPARIETIDVMPRRMGQNWGKLAMRYQARWHQDQS